MNYALDAGPMVAFLANEQGIDVVEDLLTESGSVCYAHIYNLCEVYYLFYRRAGMSVADNVIQDLLDVGIVPRADSDMAFWKDAGSIKARHPLSLPDAFSIALARRIGGAVVTTDHGEFDPLVSLGYCPIVFIR